MKARVFITLKEEVLDPQGNAVVGGLKTLGYHNVKDARVGKMIELELESQDRETSTSLVQEMCQKLLANTVIEDYRIEIV